MEACKARLRFVVIGGNSKRRGNPGGDCRTGGTWEQNYHPMSNLRIVANCAEGSPFVKISAFCSKVETQRAEIWPLESERADL